MLTCWKIKPTNNGFKTTAGRRVSKQNMNRKTVVLSVKLLFVTNKNIFQ